MNVAVGVAHRALLRSLYSTAVSCFRPTTRFPNTAHGIAQVSTLMNAHNQTNESIDSLMEMVLILAKRVEALEDEIKG